MLDIYNKILDRRLERKKFIFSRNLTDFKRIQTMEKKRARENRGEKEILVKARPFARMQTNQDFELFTQGLSEEAHLRAKISQYQEYRRMGLKNIRFTLLFNLVKYRIMSAIRKIEVRL